MIPDSRGETPAETAVSEMMAAQDIPRLRGHHLICLFFFQGEGYDEPFVSNLLDVMRSLDEAGQCLVAEGADDVCGSCPWLAPDGRCQEPNGGEDEIRRIDTLALALLGATPGEYLSRRALREVVMSPAVAKPWLRDACQDCEWEGVCRPRWNEALSDRKR